MSAFERQATPEYYEVYSTVDIGLKYLGREMVRAEQQWERLHRIGSFERAEIWAAYRSRVAYWRFCFIRSRVTPNLRACENCGRVVQAATPVLSCFACEAFQ